MKNFLSHTSVSKIRTYIVAHKIISGIVLVVVLFGGYKTVQHLRDTSGETKYVLGTAEKGTISSTVSASGQVSALKQIDLKAKTSGDIISVRVKAGDEVAAGALIASIDSSDARIALRNAEISLQKLAAPTDEATVLQAKNALTDAENAQANSYTDSLVDVGSAFQDFSGVIEGMNSLLYGSSGYLNDQNVSPLGPTAITYKTNAGVEFDKAKNEEAALAELYATVNSSSDNAQIQNIASRTLSTLKDLLTSLKDAQTAVNYIRNTQLSSSNQGMVKIATTLGTTAQADVSTWINQMNTHATALTNDATTIQNAPSVVAAKKLAYDNLVRGADPLDIESQELSLSQKQSAYNDSFITAPFGGTVAKVDIKAGDSISSGGAAATLITKEQVASISLNEVDIAKVTTGDKAMLTFDAVDGLEISGVLSEIDRVGTVSQGVVSYSAKVTFDTDDSRILPGMSVSVSIITNAKSDVLVVPTSAVKTANGSSYVLVFDTPLANTGGTAGVASVVAPHQQEVEIGLSDDTSTEIVSGLTEGQQVVTRTILPSAVTAVTSSASSLFGGNRAGGGATRALGR